MKEEKNQSSYRPSTRKDLCSNCKSTSSPEWRRGANGSLYFFFYLLFFFFSFSFFFKKNNFCFD